MFATPEWLGIDEIHLLGQPRCVMTNIEARTMIELLATRKKETVARYLMRVKDRQKIKLVTMDMWTPYRDLVHTVLPQANIVIDKFHIQRMANEALEIVRKTLREQLTDRQHRTLKMHDRYLLLRRTHDLTASDRLILEAWTENIPVLKQAYDLKESFFVLWDELEGVQARERYRAWQRSIPESLRAAFDPLTTAMENWKTEIFRYWDYPITNAYTESLNALIRSLSRMGHGFSLETIRAKMLFGTGLHKQARPKFERRPGGIYPASPLEGSSPLLLGTDLSTLAQKITSGEF